MKNFTIGNRYVKLCNEIWAVIRCMKAAFYRPDYQKLLMCLLIKKPGYGFVSKHALKGLKESIKLLKPSVKLLKHSAKLLRI